MKSHDLVLCMSVAEIVKDRLEIAHLEEVQMINLLPTSLATSSTKMRVKKSAWIAAALTKRTHIQAKDVEATVC